MSETESWLLQSMDEKLEKMREQALTVMERAHQLELAQGQGESRFQTALQEHQLALKELEQSLQYLSHKTQLQLKDSENKVEHFMQTTENKVQDIHHATREELSALARRVEILEKLLF